MAIKLELTKEQFEKFSNELFEFQTENPGQDVAVEITNEHLIVPLGVYNNVNWNKGIDTPKRKELLKQFELHVMKFFPA